MGQSKNLGNATWWSLLRHPLVFLMISPQSFRIRWRTPKNPSIAPSRAAGALLFHLFFKSAEPNSSQRTNGEMANQEIHRFFFGIRTYECLIYSLVTVMTSGNGGNSRRTPPHENIIVAFAAFTAWHDGTTRRFCAALESSSAPGAARALRHQRSLN